jgi:hypothetical protein
MLMLVLKAAARACARATLRDSFTCCCSLCHPQGHAAAATAAAAAPPSSSVPMQARNR